jgi:hypothetical protein
MPGVKLASCCLVVGLAFAGLALLPVAPAHAETAAQFCARAGTDDTLRPIPAELVPAVNALFRTTMPAQTAIDTTVFRCANGQVLVCTTGANLPCGKADTERTSTGAGQWCREHPDAGSIPAFATGHATVFQWRCRAAAAEIVRQIYRVDARGFVAAYWKSLP